MAESLLDSIPGVWTFWETGTFPIISVHQILFGTYMLGSGDPAVTVTRRRLGALSPEGRGSGWLLV